MKGILRFFALCLAISIAASHTAPVSADALQDILDKKRDVEQALKEIEMYANGNNGYRSPDQSLELAIGRLEGHLKSMDLRLESLPACTKAPAAPNTKDALDALQRLIPITPISKRTKELNNRITFLESLLPGITWCHDYCLNRVTGDEHNLRSPSELSKRLEIEGFKKAHTITAHTPGADKLLRRDDVVIFVDPTGGGHSGIVVSDTGMIDHFFQEFGKTGTKRTPAEAHQLRNKGWTLSQIFNIERQDKKYHPNGKVTIVRSKPFYHLPVEVWRPQISDTKTTQQRLAEAKKELNLHPYFAGLLQRLEDAIKDSKWIQDPTRFEKTKSEIKVTVVEDKTGLPLSTANVNVSPNAGTQRRASNPFEFEDVNNGSYTVTADAPGFVKETAPVEVTACKTHSVAIRLKKRPVIKVVDIKDEEGHLIDNVKVEVTEIASGSSKGSKTYNRVPELFVVDPGAFTVTATDIGTMYEPASQSVNAEAGEETEVHLVMRAASRADLVVEVYDSLSRLKIDPPPGSTEPGVKLEPLDGQPAPSSKPDTGGGEVLFDHIREGRYKYIVSFCGWESQSGTLTFSADDLKAKRIVRQVSVKPHALDSFTGNVMETGTDNHIDGFKVSLIGLGPRQGYRYDTEEGKDPDPNSRTRFGAFIIKGPIYSGRYKLVITGACFKPLVVDSWWTFCGLPLNRGTYTPQFLRLDPTPEFEEARRQATALIKKINAEREKAKKAADQIQAARRNAQGLSDLANELIAEFQALIQRYPGLETNCTKASLAIAEVEPAIKTIKDATTKIVTLRETTIALTDVARELADRAKKTTDPTKASNLVQNSKKFAEQARKKATETSKQAEEARNAYNQIAPKLTEIEQLEEKANNLRKDFARFSGKLQDLRKRLDSLGMTATALAEAEASLMEANKLVAAVRQLLLECANNHPVKVIVENAEQARKGVAGERQRAVDEEKLLQQILGGAQQSATQADSLGKSIENALKSCDSLKGMGATGADAKATVDTIEVFALSAEQSAREAEEVSGKIAGLDPADLSKAIRALEEKVATWNNDLTEAAAKVQSVRTGADQAALAKKRVDTLITEINSATTALGTTNQLACEKAAQLKQDIRTSEAEAKQKEQNLKQLLDEASTRATRCSSAGDADVVRNNHRAAIRLAGEIGVLEKKAQKNNADLSSLSQQMTVSKDAFRKAEERIGRIDVELRAVGITTAKAETDFNRAADLSRDLVSRRASLIAELQTLRSSSGIVYNEGTGHISEGLPPDLKKRLDAIPGLLGKAIPALPNAELLATLQDMLGTVQVGKATAEKTVAGYRSGICSIEMMDDVVQGFGATLFGATIELSAAATLPNKADECATRAACQPLINSMRAALDRNDLKSAEVLLPQLEMLRCDTSSLKRELDAKTQREVADLINRSKQNCRFQDALNLARQIPPLIKSMPLVAEALSDVERGLKAQKRITGLIDEADKTNNIAAARSANAEARRLAAPYPCLEEMMIDIPEKPTDVVPDFVRQTGKGNLPPKDNVPDFVKQTGKGNLPPKDNVPDFVKQTGKGEPPPKDVVPDFVRQTGKGEPPPKNDVPDFVKDTGTGGSGGSTASSSKPANWNGTWQWHPSGNITMTVTISGNNDSLSASYQWTDRGLGTRGTGSWACTVTGTGNTAVCTFTENYADGDKTGLRKGTVDLTLSGDTIAGTVEDGETPRWNWKPGVAQYTSKIGKGARWPLTLKRQ